MLENWLESNPDGILEDGKLLIIGRQVSTNLGGFIDLLGIDREGNVVVVELKRDRTPRETIAQSLEYASSVERLDVVQLERILRSYLSDESLILAEHHREYFELDAAEAVAFNKDQRVVVVGQRMARGVRQTASFLRSKGVMVTCIEVSFFQADGRNPLLSQDCVVGKESDRSVPTVSAPRARVTEEEFLASCDENGRAVFSHILELARQKSMPLHWGSKGFSLNADLDGTDVAICFGYPPDSVYKQSIYTGLHSPGGVEKKTETPDQAIETLRQQAEATGLFAVAGRDLRCRVTRMFTDAEVSSLLAWCESVEKAIQEYGQKRVEATEDRYLGAEE